MKWCEMAFNEEALKNIAETTKGQYFPATDTASLKKTFSEIDQMEKTKVEVEKTADYHDLFPGLFWPVSSSSAPRSCFPKRYGNVFPDFCRTALVHRTGHRAHHRGACTFGRSDGAIH